MNLFKAIGQMPRQKIDSIKIDSLMFTMWPQNKNEWKKVTTCHCGLMSKGQFWDIILYKNTRKN